MKNRRSFLSGLAVLPIIGASVAPSSADPIPALYAEKLLLCNAIDAGLYASDEEAETLMDRRNSCDMRAAASRPTTMAGAVASIEWVRAEILQFGFDEKSDDHGAELVRALLDGALEVMRSTSRA